MTVLSVDTSTPELSVAVSQNRQILSQKIYTDDIPASRIVFSMADECLKWAGKSLEDVDLFAVSSGPGSFTGLRLGISMMNGFSIATGKPAVGVKTLHAMAESVQKRDGLICPLLDARKSEIYGAAFRYADGKLKQVLGDFAEKPEIFLKRIKEEAFFLGNGAVLYREKIGTILKGKAQIGISHPDMSVAAAVGRLAYENKMTGGDSGVRANYIRRCEAETKREAKMIQH